MAGTPAVHPSTHAESKHPAPGTKIVHFSEVDEGVYKGSAPSNDADYRFLQSKKIRYIVDIHFWPVLPKLEKRKAAKYGIEVIPAVLPAAPFPPTERQVTRILALLRDRQHRPVYFHCVLGRHRTALIAALYKMYFDGMSQEDAMQYMRDGGYKNYWTVRGLQAYLKTHPKAPSGLD